MLLTVPQRRRLIADLRVAGHGAPVVIQVLLFDALVLGTVGVVVGLLIGDAALAPPVQRDPGYLRSRSRSGRSGS